MKKLLLLALVAVGVVVVARSKSEQLKGAAAKVTGDPRVQSALATATEKAGPYVSQVQHKAGPVVSQVGDKVSTATTAASSFAADRLGKSGEPETGNLENVPSEAVDEVAAEDPVSAPDFEPEEPAAPAAPAASPRPDDTAVMPAVSPGAEPVTEPVYGSAPEPASSPYAAEGAAPVAEPAEPAESDEPEGQAGGEQPEFTGFEPSTGSAAGPAGDPLTDPLPTEPSTERGDPTDPTRE